MAIVKLVRSDMPNLIPMTHRAPGMHVSTIINDLCVRMGHYDPKAFENNQARLELGNALEHAIAERFELDDPSRYVRVGELWLDGISGNPDLIEPRRRTDHEIKLTFMSSRWGPGSKKFWKYETQLKAYLHMLGWTSGRLHVCFVNGDYSWRRKKGAGLRGKKIGGNDGPVYRVWDYQFTHTELLMNWNVIRRHGERLEREEAQATQATQTTQAAQPGTRRRLVTRKAA